MIAPTQIKKPENWQDFEKLCKKLWGEVWKCSSSIRRNGRNGQNQSGVDIYGIPKGEEKYFGIQCKGKDENIGSTLTKLEIDKEINNAKKFVPLLGNLIIATSANKDVEIETYIREKNIENIKKGLFSIELACWGDIVDLLEEHRETFNWYVNNCQYKDESDVSVTFEEQSECTINPEYIKIEKHYYIKPEESSNSIYNLIQKQSLLMNKITIPEVPNLNSINDKMHPKVKKDYRLCTVQLKVKNIGSTVIEDYKIELWIDPNKIDKLSDKFKYFNPSSFVDHSVVAIENKKREERREVFESEIYRNVIEYRPLKPILVQDDYIRFKVGIKPIDNIQTIDMVWTLKSRNYKKNGKLLINVCPKYEKKIERIEVDSEREPEIEIKPKIIEE